MQSFDILQFEGSEDCLKKQTGFWLIDEIRIVEFFHGIWSKVHLIDIFHPDLESILDSINDNYITIDFEWKPSHGNDQERPISLIQLGFEEGAIIIRYPVGFHSEIVKTFLATRSFIGKGSHNDKAKLKSLFGENFFINLEDVEITRIRPNRHPASFLDMVEFYYKPPAAPFKDPSISCSNWENEMLSINQVLYAAFDVVGLYFAFRSMPEPIHTNDPTIKGKKGSKIKKQQDPVQTLKFEKDRWCLCISNLSTDVSDDMILSLIPNGNEYHIEYLGDMKWGKPIRRIFLRSKEERNHIFDFLFLKTIGSEKPFIDKSDKPHERSKSQILNLYTIKE